MKILLAILIYAVTSVDAEVIGNDCDAGPAGHQIVGCEKIKTWSLERLTTPSAWRTDYQYLLKVSRKEKKKK